MISRALVAILLMMNLGVAAWWLLRDPAATQGVAAASLAAVPTLVLLSERPAPQDPGGGRAAVRATTAAPAVVATTPPPPPAASAPAAAPAAAGADAERSTHCFRIGPFQSLADLRRVSAAIEPALQRQQVREATGIEARGYRVYLPAFASRQQALETARALETRGLRDYYVVTAGAGENTVSLGLFRELANAEARREEVRGYGFEASLEPRNEEVTRWWLEIAAPADSGWRERAGSFPGTRVEAMTCQ